MWTEPRGSDATLPALAPHWCHSPDLLAVGLIEAAPTNWTWNGWMADSLGTLQSQINSLVAVSLQNR